MARTMAGRPAGNGFTHFWERVDRVLLPVFEAPVLHDADRDVGPIGAAPCPVCGHPMTEHAIERSEYDTVLECPTSERLPLASTHSPLNEFGMPLSGRRRERYEQELATTG
ncbi:hypothetical protein [Agromyces seonyuensis]|uniref:Uncharacterized protein n=1 Tax=Agromyces seonyuensis TaxID=2662446 RepID=A0A6I4NXF3_9MICO|nr:hypothetical protein [Agromyces seonyuensis]MWB97802.1 hypothetical protein [Agromyces seonyuensis]